MPPIFERRFLTDSNFKNYKMSKIKVTIDGKQKEYQKGITALEIVKDLKKEKEAIVAKTDKGFVDLSTKINKDTEFKVITFKDTEGKKVFWHSASHLMTQAVLRIFKNQNIGLGVGTATDDGYYQDYDIKNIHSDDLKRIEKEMKKIVHEKLDITQKDITKKKALEFYKKDPYKIELANAVPGENVSMYSQGEFDNLCKGPHVPNTSYIKSFKLMKIAGAYWRGDSNNKMLTRIYGIAFPDKTELKEYLHLLEEAEKRDHRKLGKQLDLFSIHEEAPGMPFFHNKGTHIYNKLTEFMRFQLEKRNYEENKTPIILNKDLWLRSGHWDHYKENMYFTKIDDKDFAVKPMNCPGNLLIYKSKAHSYRDLPLKAGEFGLVHRHELSGVLSGLFRVRVFTQDDAHVFCTEEQLQDQIIELIELVDEVYSTFDFKYDIELSTRPEKAMGDKKLWDKAESALQKALEKKKLKYKINEGEGAFYGPKIDYHIKDAIGRSWQCGTIQVDFSMPEKFDLTYQAKDGKKHRPVMLHRAIYGSIERFLGILIEHFAGKFPLWIAPVHARVLTITNSFDKYGEEIAKKLEKDLIVERDYRAESLGYKIREAQSKKIPLIIIVGEKEQQNKTIAVRTLDNKVHYGVKTEDLLKKVLKNIEDKEVGFGM